MLCCPVQTAHANSHTSSQNQINMHAVHNYVRGGGAGSVLWASNASFLHVDCRPPEPLAVDEHGGDVFQLTRSAVDEKLAQLMRDRGKQLQDQ